MVVNQASLSYIIPELGFTSITDRQDDDESRGHRDEPQKLSGNADYKQGYREPQAACRCLDDFP